MSCRTLLYDIRPKIEIQDHSWRHNSENNTLFYLCHLFVLTGDTETSLIVNAVRSQLGILCKIAYKKPIVYMKNRFHILFQAFWKDFRLTGLKKAVTCDINAVAV